MGGFFKKLFGGREKETDPGVSSASEPSLADEKREGDASAPDISKAADRPGSADTARDDIAEYEKNPAGTSEPAADIEGAAKSDLDEDSDDIYKGKEKKRRGRARVFDNRELSWLKFNTRVLEEAEDESNPFCERLSFASIYQSNLDEFFRVRVGSLYDQMLISKEIRDNKTNMTCQEQLLSIFDEVKQLSLRKDRNYADLKMQMEKMGVRICGFSELTESDAQFLESYFQREVRPLLSPQILGKKQPFPFLRNQDIYAVVVMERERIDKKTAAKSEKKIARKLGIVPCTVDVIPRLVRIPGYENTFVLMEELILHYVPMIFERYQIVSKSLIRIIRNADIDPDEEMYGDDADFRKIMEQLVSKRRRLAPIKLEYSRLMEETVLLTLCKHLGLKKRHIFYSEAPLDLSFFSQIRDILHSDRSLFYSTYTPQFPSDIDRDRSILEQVEEKDRFLFYPYDSMEPFLKLLREAAEDPDVISIKMTLYRVANDSKVVEALLRAAECGKDVLVLLELRARFDEANNIGWSRRLEEMGCRVLYGLDNLKVHSKLCLITRREKGRIRYITQIGTGNYNETTAKLYTDLALMTAHEEIGEEANQVFLTLGMGHVVDRARLLMVAPKCLRDRILERIDSQIEKAKGGADAYVGAKMNSLTDKVIIEKLMEASRAGVKVELIVRGSCCLIAGVPGQTENITVRSIVGRYLEHSRIYIFGDEEVYISSADFMTRNTIRRVEVAVPVYDEDIKRRIRHIFDIQMQDNIKARIQMPDGRYERAAGGGALDAQRFFEEESNRLAPEREYSGAAPG